MAKTYIDTVKYLVYSNVEIGGLVEKPDVVGAIFGQTEGLLGDELDLRDLQKNGRIGRIEVDLNEKDGKTVGIIKIPSSLDMVETCIIAAALETVDRVGPCEANIRVTKVEDTRNIKRKTLLERAKGLLRALINTELPESREISDMVREEVKSAEVSEYGRDRLAAGPGIDKFDEIVFVEGRADVINLLKNDLKNVVAIGGAKVTPTILMLSKQKEVTVFLDGDRGGDIILNELVQAGAEIDFVARAPTGKEVEELTRKELIKCIRGKVPFEQGKSEEAKSRREQRDFSSRRESYPQREPFSPREQFREQKFERPSPRVESFEKSEAPVFQEKKHDAPIEPLPPLDADSFVDVSKPKEEKSEPEKKKYVPKKEEKSEEKPAFEVVKVNKDDLITELEGLSNTLKARMYNSEFERVKEIPVRDVIKAIGEVNDIHAIVFDGIITQRLVDLAASRGVKTIVGVKIGNVNKKPEGIEIITKVK